MKFYKNEAREAASNPDLSALTWRLLALAAGYSKPGGHAEFASGEIARLLPQSIDRQTGEITPYTSRRLNQALGAGKEAGLFAPDSSLRCIVLPVTTLEDDRRVSAVPCKVHGHNLAWVGGGWVDPGVAQVREMMTRRRSDERRAA